MARNSWSSSWYWWADIDDWYWLYWPEGSKESQLGGTETSNPPRFITLLSESCHAQPSAPPCIPLHAPYSSFLTKLRAQPCAHARPVRATVNIPDCATIHVIVRAHAHPPLQIPCMYLRVNWKKLWLQASHTPDYHKVVHIKNRTGW